VNYRTLSNGVQAIQWTRDNLNEVLEFTGLNPQYAKLTKPTLEIVVYTQGLLVYTPHGPVRVPIRDWIIKYQNGDLHPVRESLFHELFAPT
jgi:hypothetical protein